MVETLLDQQWIFFAVIFFGIIGYVSWIRWLDHRWIESRFSKEKVIAMSFGVNYFGKTSDPGGPKRSSGFLVLTHNGILYRSRRSNLVVEVAGANIENIYPDSAHKGVDLHQSVIKIDFSNETGNSDSVAFRVPYPPQWINAIKQISPRLKPNHP